MTTATNTCSAGTCTCNGSIACAGGQVCMGAGCSCPSNERLCNGLCIPSGNCCADSDCASTTTNTCTGGACTCNGLPVCGGGEQCGTTGCACPGGDKLCGSTCIPAANCCTDDDCTSPPDVCHQSPGTCSSGGCSYTPVAPVPVRSCSAPMTGQTLNNVVVDGICVVTMYYCSASDLPFGQATPSGYANVPSNPAGCDYNGCSDAGTDNCHENFCADALGNCNACP